MNNIFNFKYISLLKKMATDDFDVFLSNFNNEKPFNCNLIKQYNFIHKKKKEKFSSVPHTPKRKKKLIRKIYNNKIRKPRSKKIINFSDNDTNIEEDNDKYTNQFLTVKENKTKNSNFELRNKAYEKEKEDQKCNNDNSDNKSGITNENNINLSFNIEKNIVNFINDDDIEKIRQNTAENLSKFSFNEYEEKSINTDNNDVNMEIEYEKKGKEKKSISSTYNNLSEEESSYISSCNIAQSEQDFYLEIKKSFLPCREKEQTEIYYYIINGLNTIGNYNSLYISGMPGTGKTSCVKTVIKSIENKKINSKFRSLFINCVSYSNILKIFKEIYNFIFTKKIKAKTDTYIQLIDNFFYNRDKYNSNTRLNDPSNSHIILILDEIDFLMDKTQRSLYHIFNWTTYQKSKIIIISISNTLNITEYLLPKIKSRFGDNKLMFKPYNKEELRKIINYEGINLNLFDEDALKLSCIKVAAINGDLRRVLNILKRAKEICENENINNKKTINKFHILKAYNDLFESKTVKIIKQLHIGEKIVIAAFLWKMKNDNDVLISLGNIYNFMDVLINKYNEFFGMDMHLYKFSISWEEFQKIIYNLLRLKIIELNEKKLCNMNESMVRIKFYVDEFMIACNEDGEFEPILKFLESS